MDNNKLKYRASVEISMGVSKNDLKEAAIGFAVTSAGTMAGICMGNYIHKSQSTDARFPLVSTIFSGIMAGFLFGSGMLMGASLKANQISNNQN